jgi:DNA-binding HxlR family transcriptional regulator
MDRINRKYVKDILNIISKANKKGLLHKDIVNHTRLGPVPISRSLAVMMKENLVTRFNEHSIFIRYTITKKGMQVNDAIKKLDDILDS